MAGLDLSQAIAIVTIATLLAIVYSLRYLVIMERRIANIDKHIERMVKGLDRNVDELLDDEEKILRAVKGKKAKKLK